MQTLPQLARPGPSGTVLRAMFEARKRVFIDLLKWDIPVLAGAYELDQFDDPDAEYLILADSEEKHRGSVRLLRTEGPHILADLFAFLCNGPVPSRCDLREITRFCIEPTLPRQDRKDVRNRLVTALVDHALAKGITGYTAVAGTGWYRQIADFGWRCRALGPELDVGRERLVALRIDIDEDTPAALARNDIYRPGAVRSGGIEMADAA